MKKFKSYEISLITPILCLAVVFGHVTSHAIQNLNKASFQFVAIYIFWRLAHSAVPTFIALSAAKMCLKYKDTKFDLKLYLNFIKGRIINIYIPYLIWIMIFYIYFCAIEYFSFNLVDYFWYVIRGNIAAPFYFIVVIMQFYIFMPFWLYIVKKYNVIFIISMAMLIMITLIYDLPSLLNMLFGVDFKYNDRIFTSYLLYWICGCYVGIYYDKFRLFIKENKNIITICFIITSVLDIVLSYLQYSGIQRFMSLETIRVFHCIFTILFLFRVFSNYDRKNNILTSILYNINKCSFYIYLSHCFVIDIINNTFEKNDVKDIGVTFVVRFILTYSITILLSNLYIHLKNWFKNKFFKFNS